MMALQRTFSLFLLFSSLSTVRSFLIVGAGLLAVLLVIIMVSIVSISLYIVNTLIRPNKRNNLADSPHSFDLNLPSEDVYFPSRRGTHQVRGLYVPREGATSTILVSPGYRRGLKDIVGMGKHLWEAGHSILFFEYYGHGSAVGVPVTLGYREVDDFFGAVAYAETRTPKNRLGALGFSMGGAVSLIGTSQAHQVKAVVADCPFSTHWNVVEMAVHKTLRFSAHVPRWVISFLRLVTDFFLWLRAGYHFHQVEPLRCIGSIAPRPVLLIQAEQDTIVDPRNGRQLYEAAGYPKEFWMQPNTGHVRGYFTDPTQYVARVAAFFEQHLITPPPSIPDIPVQLTQEPVQQATSLGASPGEPAEKKETPPHFASRYGASVYRFRWIIVVLWALILLTSAPFAAKVTEVLTDSGYTIADSESLQVNKILIDRLHQPATQILVVLHADHTRVGAPAYQQELREVLARAKQISHVMTVTQGRQGRDSRTTFLALGFQQDKDTVAQYVPDLRRQLTLGGSHPAVISLTGDPVVANDLERATQNDTEAAERIALPITLLVLFVVFGTLSAALMPLLLAGTAVVTALAVVYGIAIRSETNAFAYNIVSVIGLGLAIDYSLFIIRRFREELAQGYSTRQAIETTVATAGEAIVFSATIVVIGFSGLLLIGIEIMSSFALGGIAVALIAALAALTLLPALLSILGPAINALPVPLLARWSERAKGRSCAQGGMWQRWVFFVMRWPIPLIVVVLLMLAFLGWPARQLNPGMTNIDALPSSLESRQAFLLLSQEFPQENLDPLVLVARSSNGSSILSSQNLERIDALTVWIGQQKHVTHVVSLTRPPQTPGTPPLSRQQLFQLYRSGQYQKIPALSLLVHQIASGDTTMMSIQSDTIAGSLADQTLIDQLRAPSPHKAGLLTHIGGTRAINMDFMRVLYGNFVRTLVFILVATFFLLLIMFKSILLPLKAIVMNILSISACYGALVWIFQDGNFQSLLGFTANGIIDRFIPPILFCVTFGLSMDYEVFLLSRVREEWLLTHDNQHAVARGIEKTGSVISNAALLFMIISGTFILSKLVIIKQLGLGLVVAVGVDSTIIRLLLVPATMQLLGTWNWWFPGRPQLSRIVGWAKGVPALVHSAHQHSFFSGAWEKGVHQENHLEDNTEKITGEKQMLSPHLPKNGSDQTERAVSEEGVTLQNEQSMQTRAEDHVNQLVTPPFPDHSPLSVRNPTVKKRSRHKRRSLVLIASLVSLLVLVSATVLTVLFIGQPAATTGPALSVTHVGTLSFLSSGQLDPTSSQGLNDKISLELEHLIPPAQGHAYYAWLLPDTTNDETKPLLLGILTIQAGKAGLTYTSPMHTNLLATFSRFRVTEQDRGVAPAMPSLDPRTWRYSGEISNIPTPGDERQYSLLSHMRHLLAQDPTLQSIGLHGGLDIWLYRNTGKLLEYSTAARDDWRNTGATDLLHRQIIRILDYLDGSAYVWQDVPAGTPFLIDPKAGRFGLLEMTPTQSPPGYLAHVDIHLQGLANAPGHTDGQRKLAIQIDQMVGGISTAMQNMRKDAVHLVGMGKNQLLQQQALDLIDDIVTYANLAYVGQPDPKTGQDIGGMTFLHNTLQGLATMPITTLTKEA